MTTLAPDIADTIPPEVLNDSGVKMNADGSIRKKPGPKPGSRNRTTATKRAAAPGMRAPTMPKKAPAQDYRPAILGLAQIPQLALGLAAKFAKRDELRTALVLDGMTVGIHAPNIAEAVNTTAQTDEKLARILDKLSTVGPYSLVVAAVLTPVAQVLANHGVMAPNPQMGILPADELAAVASQMAGVS
jgi:hypothetical protein